MEFLAQRYDTFEIVRCEIVGNTLRQLTPASPAHTSGEQNLPYVAPAFVDLQVNGYGGREFTDLALSSQDVYRISVSLAASGVSQYCPTLTTHSYERLAQSLATLARAAEEFPEVRSRVLGVHVEGPYISAADGPRGAHLREHCRPPNWDEFQRLQAAAAGNIRVLTLSPEYAESADFIRRVASTGVVVAIGHTQASGDQIRAAVEAGARMSTHLGNGTHAVLPRHPNYIWDQLADDRLWASFIVDGHHLPPSVVKSFVRAKGANRCLLISDITGLAGMPPGEYNTGLGRVEVLENGRLVVAGQRQYLAGAALPIGVGVANVMRFAEVDLKTAVHMAALRPLELLGLNSVRDGAPLSPGSPANLVLFTLPGARGEGDLGELTVRAAIHAGQLAYGTLSPVSANHPS